MLTLFYSPHMTSVDNEAGRASGHADVPLSEAGRREAHELGQHYAALSLDAVFSSDLQRASTTAEIAFAPRALPIVLDARLRECDYGELTQCPRAQVEAEFARRIAEPFPGGESLRMGAARVGAFLRAMMPAYDGKTVVVIGHRATKYGLEYWSGATPLDAIVTAAWEWRDIPIWRFEFNPHDLLRHATNR
jgi:broad specificity phosphatase PhoE